MTIPGRRPERVGQQILEEISEMIAGELKDPRIGFATVTAVRVTPDLRQAFVFVSVMGDAKEKTETLAGLRSARRFIRRELAQRLNTRRIPEVDFELDQTAERGARIEELLREVREEPPDEN